MANSVLHITFSLSGGAGHVANQLSLAQRELGWNSDVFCLTESNLHEKPLSLPLHTAAAALDNFVVRKNSFASLFSLFRDSLTTGLGNKIQNADIVNLHWINGVVDLGAIHKLFPEKPIVWTLHDMNPFTGGCHQSIGCEGFLSDCQKCPAVWQVFQVSVAKNLARKKLLATSFFNLTTVAPSPWLATMAEQSQVLAGVENVVIANPIRPLFFSQKSRKPDVHELPYFLLVASDTEDELKRVSFAVECFQALRGQHPTALLAIVGKHSSRFAKIPGVTTTEHLEGDKLAIQMEGAIALLVPSLAENAPLVIAEAAALGTPSIVNAIPSLTSMVSWLEAGLSAGPLQEWATAMEVLLLGNDTVETHEVRKALMNRADRLFHPTAVATQYLDLYERVS